MGAGNAKDALAKLANRPIPPITATATAADYHQIPVTDRHPQRLEPLVDVRSVGLAAESYYARSDGLNPPYYAPIAHALPSVWCRRSVAEALCEVNRTLHFLGLELFLLDGYRPVACQRALWDHFIQIAKKVLPDPTPEACFAFVSQYWSDPSRFDERDYRTWPTHATGGAIDLTLRRLGSGELLYMGGVFDDTSELSHTRFFEDARHESSASGLEARRNRRLLFWSLVEAGFANYAYEWWHFDLGTQMWVMNRRFLETGESPAEAYFGYIAAPV